MTTAEGAKHAIVGRLTGGLEGKVAIVTGGTRGIGYAIAENLVALGVKVLICSRKQADVDKAASALQAKGLSVQGTAVDIAEPAGRHKLLMQAINGKLDILESFLLEQHQQIIKINLEAVLALTAAAHPLLKASGSATIIMISSIGGGPLAIESCASYAMSKGAIDTFTKYLAVEWARDGISCNAIKPGYTETEMIADFVASGGGKRVIAKIPHARLGAVGDISGLAVFLASASAWYMTGQLITVDGSHSIVGNWSSRP